MRALKDIKLLILDVDGTLTDGKLYYGEDGSEMKTFHTQDGLGIAMWHYLGGITAVISGRQSQAAARRCRELGIFEIHLGVRDKKKVALEMLHRCNVPANKCACIGDDLNDLALFELCGLNFAPFNASDWVLAKADIVLSRTGGNGCVREAIDKILQAQNLEERVLEYFKK